ncbi:MAG: HU family DNA-binding protein [Firmicutes bacterium]|nr:HU family DNA-binding protein [Bacillota bacterium]
MGKSDLVDMIAKKAEISKKDAAAALNTILKTVEDELKSGNSVRLIPFGSFEVRDRKGRTGRNPRTGDEINIDARKVPAFKPGKALKDAVK